MREEIAIAVILNFAAWALLGLTLGGDALNGKATSGKYFLGAKGRFIEVSIAKYVYSYVHTLLTIASFVALVGLGLCRELGALGARRKQDRVKNGADNLIKWTLR